MSLDDDLTDDFENGNLDGLAVEIVGLVVVAGALWTILAWINSQGNRMFRRREASENSGELIRGCLYSIRPADVCRGRYL